MDDALNGSQSYSSAFKLFSKVQTLKHTKQFIYILRVEAYAIVPHEHLYFTFSVHTANLDFGPGTHTCEFDRIGNKVDSEQLDEVMNRLRIGERGDLPFN